MPQPPYSIRYPGDAHLEFWEAKLRNPPGYVYVIRGDPNGPIKVGFATDVRARMNALQTGCAWELRLLYVFPGPQKLEWFLHQRLKGYRMKGEWFGGEGAKRFLEVDCPELVTQFMDAYDGTCNAPDYTDLDKRFRPPRRNGTQPVEIRFTEPDPIPPEILEERRREAIMLGYMVRNGRKS